MKLDQEAKERLSAWVTTWNETGRLLKELKVVEHDRADRFETIWSMSDASAAALVDYPAKPTSGLIEMQRLFSKLRR